MQISASHHGERCPSIHQVAYRIKEQLSYMQEGYKSNGQQPVPSAAQYPRRGAGRKGAYRRRMRWGQRHPCPLTTTSTAARTREQGTSRVESQTSGQGIRVLCVPYTMGIYGRSRLITVSRKRCSMALSWRMSCSSQAHDQQQVPLAGLRSGMAQDWAWIVGGHQGCGYPIASAPEA